MSSRKVKEDILINIDDRLERIEDIVKWIKQAMKD